MKLKLFMYKYMNELKENLKNKFTVNQWELIQSVLAGRTKTWLELAEDFNINPSTSNNQRSKAANDI